MYLTSRAVEGHAGELVFGKLGPEECAVALMVGRAQYGVLGLLRRAATRKLIPFKMQFL